MLKAKDATDVVLMNNFLADFPVEEVVQISVTWHMKLLGFGSFNTSSRCQTISNLGEAWGHMERCRDQIETTQRQTPVPGD